MKKYIINVSIFNLEKLGELKKILEKYQIIEININKVDKGEIIIEYDSDNKKIKINKDFNIKVRSVRDMYYIQLLNIVNYIHNFKKIVPNIEKSVTKFGALMDPICTTLVEDYIFKTNFENYKLLLEMAIINYVGTYNFDNIFVLNKDIMMILIKNKYQKNNNFINNSIIEYILGMYCHNDEKLLEELEKRIEISELKKIKKCKRFILICPELINEFCEKYFDRFKIYDISDITQLKVIILNKVLLHEIGHSVFDYIYDSKGEKRANYFASITFNGTFDNIIKEQTEIQAEVFKEYKNPYLISDDKLNVTKDVYLIDR